MHSLIDHSLGKRVKQAKYSYSDIILYWIYSNICGAERLEDTVFLKSQLDSIPGLQNPSPDRISGVLRSLATPKKEYTTPNGYEHEFCLHPALNKLMLDVAISLNSIYTDILDYDNVIIETEKHDSGWTYEKTKGYQPGVAFLGKTPVYIEGRNGNSPASYKMGETLRRCLQQLKSKHVPVKYFRSDSAAYQFDVIDLMNSSQIDFFIRADTTALLREEARDIDRWDTINEDGNSFELGEMLFTPFTNKGNKIVYRAVVKRVKTKDNFLYYAILTNNWKMSNLEVLQFYNKRGAMERHFDDLKNNFNWKRVPFSFMNENLVFMLVSAIASIAYNYLVRTFSQKVDFVKKTFRLKNFIFHFITVASMWANEQLWLFTDKNYLKIFE